MFVKIINGMVRVGRKTYFIVIKSAGFEHRGVIGSR